MKKVVIVDDEMLARVDFSQMMEELGFTVAGTAADGFDALELCEALHPDLVLMDLNMPIFDGVSTVQQITERGLAGAVVVVTGYGDAETVRKAVAAGADGYLVKPVDRQSLLASSEVALRAAGERRALLERAEKAEQRVEESKLIERAKGKLAKARGISEAEAYRLMQKLAMDKRSPLSAVAAGVLRSGGMEDKNRA